MTLKTKFDEFLSFLTKVLSKIFIHLAFFKQLTSIQVKLGQIPMLKLSFDLLSVLKKFPVIFKFCRALGHQMDLQMSPWKDCPNQTNKFNYFHTGNSKKFQLKAQKSNKEFPGKANQKLIVQPQIKYFQEIVKQTVLKKTVPRNHKQRKERRLSSIIKNSLAGGIFLQFQLPGSLFLTQHNKNLRVKAFKVFIFNFNRIFFHIFIIVCKFSLAHKND